MQNMQEYKCPCCGGAIAFDSTIQKMKCPYCDSEFEMETLQAMDEQLKEGKSDSMEWETKAGGEWQEGETDGLSTYVCQSCGGEIVGDAIILMRLKVCMCHSGFLIPMQMHRSATRRLISGHGVTVVTFIQRPDISLSAVAAALDLNIFRLPDHLRCRMI